MKINVATNTKLLNLIISFSRKQGHYEMKADSKNQVTNDDKTSMTSKQFPHRSLHFKHRIQGAKTRNFNFLDFLLFLFLKVLLFFVSLADLSIEGTST